MKHFHYLITLVFLSSIIFTCQQAPDFEKEKAELLAWHNFNVKAVIDGDVDTMLSVLTDGCIQLDKGKVFTLERASSEKNMRKLFTTTDFTEIDDIAEPIIHISNDGSMAWMVNQFKIKFIDTDSTGQETPGESTGGELLVFEKKNSQWVLV